MLRRDPYHPPVETFESVIYFANYQRRRSTQKSRGLFAFAIGEQTDAESRVVLFIREHRLIDRFLRVIA